MVEDLPPFKHYIVSVYDNCDYEIYCSVDPDRAFNREQVNHLFMNSSGTNATEQIYNFGAEDLISIIKMYGHHIGETDV